jgi:hypothetical protein
MKRNCTRLIRKPVQSQRNLTGAGRSSQLAQPFLLPGNLRPGKPVKMSVNVPLDTSGNARMLVDLLLSVCQICK